MSRPSRRLLTPHGWFVVAMIGASVLVAAIAIFAVITGVHP